MINDFLIINCIGNKDKIGLRIKKNFYIHDFTNKIINNDQLVSSILDLIKKYKIILNDKFSIIVNCGPGSFSSIRASISIAKGIKISKNVNLYVFRNSDLKRFNQENIELLIVNGLLQKKLIKPIYIS